MRLRRLLVDEYTDVLGVLVLGMNILTPYPPHLAALYLLIWLFIWILYYKEEDHKCTIITSVQLS